MEMTLKPRLKWQVDGAASARPCGCSELGKVRTPKKAGEAREEKEAERA